MFPYILLYFSVYVRQKTPPFVLFFIYNPSNLAIFIQSLSAYELVYQYFHLIILYYQIKLTALALLVYPSLQGLVLINLCINTHLQIEPKNKR